MSELSQGAGWWQASDGKWYPPEQHPDYRPAAPPPPPAPPAPQYGQPPAAAGYGQPVAPQAWGQPAPSGAPGAPDAAAFGQATSFGQAGGKAPKAGKAPGAGLASKLPKSRNARIGIAAAVVVVLGGGGYLLLGGGSGPANTPTGIAGQAVSDVAGGNFAALCNLVAPDKKTQCAAGSLFSSGVKITSQNVAVGNVTTQGTQAIAVITGQVCISGGLAGSTPTCASNSDPTGGLGGGESFTQAYAAATGSGGFKYLALEEVSGTWYLVYG